VVVADDEPDVRLLLRLQLQGTPGITVVGEAGDGVEVLDVCAELRPDAVVMDLLMPKMPGIEAIERLQRDLPGVGIVAYTATAGEFVRHEMDRLGVTLLLKSGDVSNLVGALRASLQQPRVE
jgi:DNA-binding NarL/FixJ family response regulator